MRVLFDHGTPSGIARALSRHADETLRYQQNLKNKNIAIVVLGNSTWRLVQPYLDSIVAAVNAATPGSYCEVEIPYPKKT